MIDKPYKLFIGKDIDRTVAIADGEGFEVVSANIAEGEIVVLDKNMKVLATNGTYAGSDTIYIAEGTARTLSYNDEAGTALTGRHILLSDPINGKLIRKVAYRPYEAKAEEVVTISAISGTITAGTEYVLRVIYGDIEEHPGQFTATYRYIAKTGDTSQNVFNGIRARIAKHAGARVIASGTTTLVLTAKPVPASTSSLQNIDEFKMVNFDVVFNFVDNDYRWSEVPLTSGISKTTAVAGSGNWEQVRDMEKFEFGYRGASNRTHFPVYTPDFRTVKNSQYEVLVIEYDADYRSPDNSYEKFTSKQVILAMEAPASEAAGQYYDVMTKISNWLDSAPFAITFVDTTIKTTVAATAIVGLTAPAKDATPVATITAGTGYTGTVVWYTAADDEVHTGAFAGSTEYYAVVTLVATTGYTMDGVVADQFTFTGSTADTNAANSGVCTVNFNATAAQ